MWPTILQSNDKDPRRCCIIQNIQTFQNFDLRGMGSVKKEEEKVEEDWKEDYEINLWLGLGTLTDVEKYR